MKKLILTSSLCAGISLASMAQNEATDSVAAETLQEIVIEAPKVIRKADMDVYHPSKSAVDASKNGMQLLNHLMIPSLTVNDALGTIQAAGQSVQVRINGRESTIDQVRALLPETIKRVEWLDNPGLRYGGASYVVNFIVANPSLGGSLQTMAMPALTEAWGNYFADAKFNVGRSQWEVGGQFKLTNNLKAGRNYHETFTYPDETSLTRTETSQDGIVDNTFGNFWGSYNYVKPDTTVFMAEIGVVRDFKNREMYQGLLSLSDGSEDILLTDDSGNDGTKPYLSLYLQQNFARRQMLVVDFSSRFLFGRSYSDYLERLPEATSYLTDVHTDIKDRNQAYAIEANYIKNWKSSRLTAGASYTANRNRSRYENLGGEVFHQRQDKLYVFAEYFHRFGKWTATAGIGAQYTSLNFKESNTGTNSWNARPQATLTYSINQNHKLRLNFTSWQSTPTLAQSNPVPQQLDGFQWRVGNPNLKTSSSYMLTFRYGFSLPRVNGSFGIRAFTSPDAITSYMQWEGDKLITSYENSQGLRNISFFLAPQIEIIPDWVMLSGYIQYRMERMKGLNYKLHNYNWSGNVEVQISHYGFDLSVQYNRAQRNLWGESISWGEDFSLINLAYNWKNWQFGAGMLMPFGRYDQGSKLMNHWNSNDKHMKVDIRIPYLRIAYNIQWGRQKRGANKLVNANAETERSTAGGR